MVEQSATDGCGCGRTVHARAAPDDRYVHWLHSRPAVGGTKRGDRRSRSGDSCDFPAVILLRGGAGANLESNSIQSTFARGFGWDERGGCGAHSGGVDHVGKRINSWRGDDRHRGDISVPVAQMECEFHMVDHWIGACGMGSKSRWVCVSRRWGTPHPTQAGYFLPPLPGLRIRQLNLLSDDRISPYL